MRLALHGIGTALPEAEDAVETSDLNSYFAPRRLRRVDHFTRMTLLAGCRALHDAAGTVQEDLKTPLDLPEDMGVVISTGYGPSQTIFEFLDSIIDHGAGCASPLAFSHSVHNIPAATMSVFLNNPKPYTTLCQLHGPLLAGLQTAGCWLAEGRVKKVLLGLVDEKTPLLEDNTRRLLENKGLAGEQIPVGEGACFFLLGSAEEANATRYGTLEFETFSPQQLPKAQLSDATYAPARSISRLSKLDISATASRQTDMPCAAAPELATAAMKNEQSCCIEQAGNNFGVISVKPQG
ncbi:beta-ketoacyl synthase chain length factor [Desulfovibrio sp. JC022]|uniref:beta-ketoacyl synthase chain length factor n=1 Tax=Desulfovibrio sp. JC022 TaxID=2593642 RepID=UPI00193EC507|nr:beta-ketoacyl synthase chain length factor [Desulfovibrio sp. JC022]